MTVDSIAAPLPAQVAEVIRKAQEILTERLLAFGGEATTTVIEFNLVRLIAHFERWSEQLATAEKWPNIIPSMRALADAYAAIRQFEATEGLARMASQATQNLVMLPQVKGRFVQVQEIVAKVEGVLADESWRTTAADSEVAFYELVLKEIKAETALPKDQAAAELERVQAAAWRDAPTLARMIDELRTSGVEPRDILVQIAWQRIEDERRVEQDRLTYEADWKIYDEIATELRDKLHWKPGSLEWKRLAYALHLTVRYFIKIFRTTPGEAAPINVDFLFAEPRGLGQGATEKHLETHFREAMWFSEGVDVVSQPKGATLGIPDLLFRFSQNIVFPIEVKREFTSIKRDHIRDRYVAQAQSYVAGTAYQVGFLFVLDLTPKEKGTPLMDMADYLYLDRCSVPGESRPIWVVVVIFPANRYLPSAHSWG